MCSIDKSIDKVSRYYWYRDTKKYRGIRDTSIVKFWYRDISKYRQYRPSLPGICSSFDLSVSALTLQYLSEYDFDAVFHKHPFFQVNQVIQFGRLSSRHAYSADVCRHYFRLSCGRLILMNCRQCIQTCNKVDATCNKLHKVEHVQLCATSRRVRNTQLVACLCNILLHKHATSRRRLVACATSCMSGRGLT